MKAVYFVATALVGVVMFGAGLLVRPALGPWEQQEATAAPEEEVKVQQTEPIHGRTLAQGYLSAEALKVRVDDGEVQWYDGVMWHTVASVEEMTKEDKFYGAQEAFQEFEEQLKQQEADRAEAENVSGQEVPLTIGEKEEPKPTEKPKPTRPAVTEPAPAPVVVPVITPVPTPAPENNGGGGSQPSAPAPDSGSNGSDGGNSGGGDSGSGSGDGGNSGSGSGDSGSSGSGGDTGSGDSGSGDQGGSDSGGSETGDGENMEWTDDYL